MAFVIIEYYSGLKTYRTQNKKHEKTVVRVFIRTTVFNRFASDFAFKETCGKNDVFFGFVAALALDG